MSEREPVIRLKRRDFIKGSAVAGAGLMLQSCKGDKAGELMEAAQTLPPSLGGRRELTAQCPYCGVGCATLIQVCIPV